MTHYTRWAIARWLIHAGLAIAPRGPARDLYLVALEAASQAIMDDLVDRGK